jgi:adenylate kinase
LLLGPPCSKKYELAQQISRKYNIPHISISGLLQQEIKSQNENSIAIINAMNSGELVNDRFVFKLLEDRLYASDCMINGWILTGFPKTKSQWNYFEEVNHSFYPTLVVVVNLLNEESKARSKSRRIDPVTGKFYQIDSEIYARENELVRKRLILKIEDKPEILNRR